MEDFERRGFVYVLVTNFGPHKFMKIGSTKEGIKKRIHKLQTGCPNKIIPHVRLVGPASKVARIEKRLHEELGKYRANGEWFRCNNKSVNDLRFSMFVAAHDENCEIFSIHNPHEPDFGGEEIKFRYLINHHYASRYKKLKGKYLFDELHEKLMEGKS